MVNTCVMTREPRDTKTLPDRYNSSQRQKLARESCCSVQLLTGEVSPSFLFSGIVTPFSEISVGHPSESSAGKQAHIHIQEAFALIGRT